MLMFNDAMLNFNKFKDRISLNICWSFMLSRH